jgi:hypothetical protein
VPRRARRPLPTSLEDADHGPPGVGVLLPLPPSSSSSTSSPASRPPSPAHESRPLTLLLLLPPTPLASVRRASLPVVLPHIGTHRSRRLPEQRHVELPPPRNPRRRGRLPLSSSRASLPPSPSPTATRPPRSLLVVVLVERVLDVREVGRGLPRSPPEVRSPRRDLVDVCRDGREGQEPEEGAAAEH